MKKFMIVLLIALALAGCQRNTEQPLPAEKAHIVTQTSSGPLMRKESQIIEMTARVQSVDLKNRMLTLKDSSGEVVQVPVSPEVKRLSEFKAGDTIIARYFESLALDVREPTKQEKESPRTVFKAGAKASQDQTPGAGIARIVHTIVTIEGINRAAKTVSVKTAEGKVVEVRARDPKNLERVKVGDTVAVTYTEGFAIGLEKVHG